MTHCVYVCFYTVGASKNPSIYNSLIRYINWHRNLMLNRLGFLPSKSIDIAEENGPFLCEILNRLLSFSIKTTLKWHRRQRNHPLLNETTYTLGDNSST